MQDGVNKNDILEKFEKEVQTQIENGVQDGVAVASENVLKPVVTKTIAFIYALVITVLLMIVVYFLARIINRVFSVSIIGKANTFLGGVLGPAKGIIVAFILCSILSLIISFTKDGFLIFTPENIEKTYLFNLFTIKI